MYILGIETSTQICSAALLHNSVLLAEVRLNLRNVHASRLFEIIASLFADAGISSTDVDGIGVSIGPGSFTGLRIGLSAAKGLAFPSDIPVVPVPTMQALAANAPITTGTICPILKSRAQEFYAAIYARDIFVDTQVQSVQVVSQDDLIEFVPNDAMLIGTTIGLRDLAVWPETISFAPQQFAMPSAISVGIIAAQNILTGHHYELESLEPSYFQEFIAGKPKSTV